MTARPDPLAPDPLAPLVVALLERARADAGATLAEADADVAATLEAARAEAEGILAEARMKGAADADAVLTAERSRAERDARAVLLAAQRVADEHVRRAARDAVSALRGDARYPSIIQTLRNRAGRTLGSGSVVSELPRGGIAAEAGGRRVEYSLDGLADDVMDRLTADPDSPWSS